jgi:hypothetical protein
VAGRPRTFPSAATATRTSPGISVASPFGVQLPGSITEEELSDRVRELMLANVKDGYSALLGRSYTYIAPALDRYVFQWFWTRVFTS